MLEPGTIPVIVHLIEFRGWRLGAVGLKVVPPIQLPPQSRPHEANGSRRTPTTHQVNDGAQNSHQGSRSNPGNSPDTPLRSSHRQPPDLLLGNANPKTSTPKVERKSDTPIGQLVRKSLRSSDGG